MSAIPPFLKPNDTIAIIAPARSISREEVAFAKSFFEAAGFHVVFGAHLFSIEHQYAGTDAARAADLQWALDNNEVKAVICARGGYGTMRIIDQIDFSQFLKNPKWVCGFSDVTVLHSHIHHVCNVQTLHCTMPITMENGAEMNREQMVKHLKGESLTYSIPAHPNNRLGTEEAEVVGGNLSILYALAGSSSEIDTKGKILLIEEVDEYLYHIDRMLLQMKRSGKLAHLKGLIIGSFTKIHDNDIPFGKTVEEIVLDHCKNTHFPIAFNVPVGHDIVNYSFCFGRKTLLKVEKEGTRIVN